MAGSYHPTLRLSQRIERVTNYKKSKLSRFSNPGNLRVITSSNNVFGGAKKSETNSEIGNVACQSDKICFSNEAEAKSKKFPITGGSQSIRLLKKRMRSRRSQRNKGLNFPKPNENIEKTKLNENNKPHPGENIDQPKPIEKVNKPKPRENIDKQKPTEEVNKPKPIGKTNKLNPSENVTKPKKPDENINKPKSIENINKPKPIEKFNKMKPIEKTNKPKPIEKANKPKPRENVDKPKPRETVDKPKPRENVDKPKPRENVDKPKPSENTKPKPSENAKPKPSENDYKRKPIENTDKQKPIRDNKKTKLNQNLNIEKPNENFNKNKKAFDKMKPNENLKKSNPIKNFNDWAPFMGFQNISIPKQNEPRLTRKQRKFQKYQEKLLTKYNKKFENPYPYIPKAMRENFDDISDAPLEDEDLEEVEVASDNEDHPNNEFSVGFRKCKPSYLKGKDIGFFRPKIYNISADRTLIICKSEMDEVEEVDEESDVIEEVEEVNVATEEDEEAIVTEEIEEVSVADEVEDNVVTVEVEDNVVTVEVVVPKKGNTVLEKVSAVLEEVSEEISAVSEKIDVNSMAEEVRYISKEVGASTDENKDIEDKNIVIVKEANISEEVHLDDVSEAEYEEIDDEEMMFIDDSEEEEMVEEEGMEESEETALISEKSVISMVHENETDVIRESLLSKETPDLHQEKAVFQDSLDAWKSHLIGMEYILEIWDKPGGQVNSYYCTLCSKDISIPEPFVTNEFIAVHISNINHMSLYIIVCGFDHCGTTLM